MSTSALAYETRPIKRVRRSADQIESLSCALVCLLASEHPMTVRQVFYRAVSAGLIEKSEAAYKQTICRLLTKLRLEGRLPFRWISDNTRWMRKPDSFSSLRSALESSFELYRRELWMNQASYVEVWLEKDALAGVVLDVTAAYDVPLMVSRGYSSISYLHTAAETIKEKGKPAFIYYFGDYDPSGMDIPRSIEKRLREFAPRAEIYFERVAVTEPQIQSLNLPTRPTKKTDSRSKNFEGESVEVDAIPPATLRLMVERCISQHIDEGALGRLQSVEAAERESFEAILGRLGELEATEL